MFVCIMISVISYLYTMPKTTTEENIQANRFIINSNQSPREISLSDINKHDATGARWNNTGHIIFDKAGVSITLPEISHARYLEITTDNNDSYLIKLLSSKLTLYSTPVSPPLKKKRGMIFHRITIPSFAGIKGFGQITITPISGDGRYSVGHIVLKDSDY